MLRTLSWVLLAIVAVLTLFGSLASARLAYLTEQDQFGSMSLADVAAGRGELATALRGRRATAAAYAAAYATALLLIVLIPYRRGETWAWWAILIATLVLTILNLARIPLLGTRLGADPASIQLGAVVLALLLDVGRLRRTSG